MTLAQPLLRVFMVDVIVWRKKLCLVIFAELSLTIPLADGVLEGVFVADVLATAFDTTTSSGHCLSQPFYDRADRQVMNMPSSQELFQLLN